MARRRQARLWMETRIDAAVSNRAHRVRPFDANRALRARRPHNPQGSVRIAPSSNLPCVIIESREIQFGREDLVQAPEVRGVTLFKRVHTCVACLQALPRRHDALTNDLTLAAFQPRP
jgi:hypothetical protein